MRTVLAMGLIALALAGCNTAEQPHLVGITMGAGDAVAHNSALQIIDPWPAGVQDTDFAVPARSARPEGDDGGMPAAADGGGTGVSTVTN